MSALVDVEGDSPEIEVAAGPSSSSSSSHGMQLLTGHNSYIASMAKLCKESECFTDVRIVCADGDIRAHRFDFIELYFFPILNAVSGLHFACHVFHHASFKVSVYKGEMRK